MKLTQQPSNVNASSSAVRHTVSPVVSNIPVPQNGANGGAVGAAISKGIHVFKKQGEGHMAAPSPTISPKNVPYVGNTNMR